MPTPNIRISQASKAEEIISITEGAKQLLRAIYAEQKKPAAVDENIPTIKVSSLISKMSFYYEKIRNSVEYKEEHLLRKNAIERIANRLIVIEGSLATRGVNPQESSNELLVELIRAGYLPNNQIPETKIDEIAQVIIKYLKLRKYFLEVKSVNSETRSEILHWIIAVMASEIEEKLGRSKADEVISTYMYEILNEKIKLPDDSPYAKDKEIQIYIGISRGLFKYDDDMLSYILIKYYNAAWTDPDDETIARIGHNLVKLHKAVKFQIEHPIALQMNRVINLYTVYFSILRDVLSEDPVKIYESFQNGPKAFSRQVREMCEKRYATAKKKLWRAAIRSIIYIFITKSVFAVILEVPASKWFGEDINPVSLAINITFPALLLFVVVAFTRMPDNENSNKIIEGINSIMFREKKSDVVYRLRQPVKRSTALNVVFGIIYTVTFFLSFGGVIWVLDKMSFSWVSTTIFLFFLAFVSFFSIRIRKNAKDLLIIDPKESILSFLIDFFYIPIVQVGKFLSEKFAKINVFVFILDFIIEAPFKIFVDMAEEWTKYVKERKDEIQ